MDSNREVPIIDQDILEVAPQEYKVGINLLADPVGVPSDHIEGRFLNIIARSSVKQNIDKCFHQAGIEIADYVISPLALANAVLTNSERRSGCMLIDFGADTTTVSVYKNNILRHLAVIPLGGSNITKDICSQQIEEEDAEELKLKYGNAYIDPSKMKKKRPTMPSTENAVLKPIYWKILWKRVSTKYWQTYGIRLCSPATMTNYWQEPLSPVVQPT